MQAFALGNAGLPPQEEGLHCLVFPADWAAVGAESV